MMNTNLLYYLTAIYETVNLTKAAKRLHLLQQALKPLYQKNDATIPFYIACLKKNYTKYQNIFN